MVEKEDVNGFAKSWLRIHGSELRVCPRDTMKRINILFILCPFRCCCADEARDLRRHDQA